MIARWAGLVALVGSLAAMACSGGAGAGGSGGAGAGGSGGAGKGGTGNAAAGTAGGGATAGAAGGASGLANGSAFPNGIGSGTKWTSGVVANLAGPYAPCGIAGTGTVVAGAANPKAPELAAASRSGVVLFFSTETGQRTRAPFYAGAPVSGVDYSRDGTELVVAGDNGVQLVRLSDGKVLFSAQPFAAYPVSATLSPDGSLIAAVGRDVPQTNSSQLGILRLLRVSDGTSVAEATANADSTPPQFSPDGSLVVAADAIFSVPGLQKGPSLGLFHDHIALSPDGTLAAQSGHVIALASGQEVKGPPAGESGVFTWAAFSPDGATYAEAYNSTVYLWRTSDWTAIGTPTNVLFFPGGSVTEAGRFFISGDGTHLVSLLTGVTIANGDYAVFQILSLPGLTQTAMVAEPHLFAGPVAFSPDGSLVASRLETSGGVWRTSDLSLVSRLNDVSQQSYGFLANGALEVWPTSVFDPLTGTKLGRSLGTAAAPDGTLAVFAPYPRTALVWLADLTTLSVLDPSALPAETSAWAFSRDNRFLAAAPNAEMGSAKAAVFDTATGMSVLTVAGGAPLAIATTAGGTARLAAFVPDASTPFASTVRVWSVPDGQALFDVAQASAQGWAAESYVPTMAFSPDGSLLAVGADGIRIFDVATGTVRQTLRAHTDPLSSAPYTGVLALAFSATGQIASVGWDGTMRLWCSGTP